MQIVCPECGKRFEDVDQCGLCVARNQQIKVTLKVCSVVAFGGIVGTVLAEGAYPRLGSSHWVFFVIAALIVIPAVTAFALDNFDRLTRYATFVRLMIVSATVGLVMLSAYFYLNGILDVNPPVEAQALVSQKYISNSEDGTAYILVFTELWNGEKFEDEIGVSPQTYDTAKPGDSERVIVHPGKFSQPWWSGVIVSNSRVSNWE